MSQPPFTPAALRGAVDLSALKRPAGPPPGGGPAAGRGRPAGRAGAPGAAGGGPGRGAGLPQSEGTVGSNVVTGTDAGFQEVANTSLRVPVVVVLWSGRLPQSRDFVDVMAGVARSNDGRFQLVSVDVDTNPGLLRAFQIQSVPSVVGLVQGQPVPLFAGALSVAEVQPWIDELLKLAVQYGVTGRVAADEAPGGPGPGTAEEPELHPLHGAAIDAIDRGDLGAAVKAYELALTENPGDTDAKLGLAQVHLLQRTSGADLAVARSAAAAEPADVDAQLLAADLDLVGGHVEDAFARLVDLVRRTAGDERDTVRQRLLELFDVVGASDERVVKARKALMSALF